MGFNTVVFFCNDATREMQADPKGFVDKIIEGTTKCDREPFDFGLGHYANGFQVVSCQHADLTTIIAAGGNYATVLGYRWGGNQGHHLPETKVAILRNLAEDLGYKLVRKPVRKG